MHQTQYVVIDHGLPFMNDDLVVVGPFDVEEAAHLTMQGSGHRYEVVPLWTPETFTASLAGDNDDDSTVDPEQAERNARTDLCDDCKPTDHPTCSLDASCACCRTTISQMED